MPHTRNSYHRVQLNSEQIRHINDFNENRRHKEVMILVCSNLEQSPFVTKFGLVSTICKNKDKIMRFGGIYSAKTWEISPTKKSFCAETHFKLKSE